MDIFMIFRIHGSNNDQLSLFYTLAILSLSPNSRRPSTSLYFPSISVNLCKCTQFLQVTFCRGYPDTGPVL